MESIYVFSEYPLAEWRLAESSGTPVNTGDLRVSAFRHSANGTFLGSCPDCQSGLLVRAVLRFLSRSGRGSGEETNRSNRTYWAQLSYLPHSAYYLTFKNQYNYDT